MNKNSVFHQRHINFFKLYSGRHHLSQHTLKKHILIQVGKERAELGAKWIHGVLGNPIYELAMMHGLVDIMQMPRPHRMVAATEGGKQVPFGILQETCEAYLCFLKRCEEYFVSQYSPPEGIDSVGEHIKLEVS